MTGRGLGGKIPYVPNSKTLLIIILLLLLFIIIIGKLGEAEIEVRVVGLTSFRDRVYIMLYMFFFCMYLCIRKSLKYVILNSCNRLPSSTHFSQMVHVLLFTLEFEPKMSRKS